MARPSRFCADSKGPLGPFVFWPPSDGPRVDPFRGARGYNRRMTEQLLQHFLLSGSQVVKLNAEMHKTVPPGGQCQARVEVKLSPSKPEDDGQPKHYLVGVRLHCQGWPPPGEEQEQLFTIELVINLAYAQFAGDPISFEDFAAHHGSLARQIYPLIQSHASTVLHQLGLSMVRLPLDLTDGGKPGAGTLH